MKLKGQCTHETSLPFDVLCRPKQWQTGFHAFRSSVIKKYDFWNCHPVLYFAQKHTILECVTRS